MVNAGIPTTPACWTYIERGRILGNVIKPKPKEAELAGSRNASSKERVLGKQVSSSGRESWKISHDGSVRTLVTSGTSAKTMDKAVVRYDRALKRLADR